MKAIIATLFVAVAVSQVQFSASEFNVMYHFDDLHEQFRYLRSDALEFNNRVQNTLRTINANKADLVCNVEWFGHETQQYYLGPIREVFPHLKKSLDVLVDMICQKLEDAQIKGHHDKVKQSLKAIHSFNSAYPEACDPKSAFVKPNLGQWLPTRSELETLLKAISHFNNEESVAVLEKVADKFKKEELAKKAEAKKKLDAANNVLLQGLVKNVVEQKPEKKDFGTQTGSSKKKQNMNLRGLSHEKKVVTSEKKKENEAPSTNPEQPRDLKAYHAHKFEEISDRLMGLIASDQIYLFNSDYTYDYFKRKDGIGMDKKEWKPAGENPKTPPTSGWAFSVLVGYNNKVFEDGDLDYYQKDGVPLETFKPNGFHVFMTGKPEEKEGKKRIAADGPSFVVKQLKVKQELMQGEEPVQVDVICLHHKSKFDGQEKRWQLSNEVSRYVKYRREKNKKVNFILMGDANTEVAEFAFDLGTPIILPEKPSEPISPVVAESKPKLVVSPIIYGHSATARRTHYNMLKGLFDAWTPKDGVTKPAKDKELDSMEKGLKKIDELLAEYNGKFKSPEAVNDFWVEVANFPTQAKIRGGEINFQDAPYQNYIKALLDHNPKLLEHVKAESKKWVEMIVNDRTSRKQAEEAELLNADPATKEKIIKRNADLVENFRSRRTDLRNQTEVEFGIIIDYLWKPIREKQVHEM